MADGAVVVLGGNATGFALAAELALAGHQVILYDAPSRAARIAALRETRQITVLREGVAATATLALVTDDPFEAFAAGDVLLASVTPSEQPAFGELLLPIVEPRHVLVLMPGGLGALAFAHWLLARGRWIDNLPTFAETDLEPFVCRKAGPASVRVFGRASRLGLGVFPGSRTARTQALLEPLLGEVMAYPHAAAAGLGAVGALLRALTVLMSSARVERGRGRFMLYDEGFTPAVANVAAVLDAERRAISAALGCEQPPLAQLLAAAGYGPAGDLWTTLHGSRALTQVRAPRTLQSPWFSGQVSHVLKTWAALGEQLDVPVPMTKAVTGLADAALGGDLSDGGRSLDDLGVEGMDRSTLMEYLDTGATD